MNLQNKYMVACALALILLPIILSTLNSDEITSTDWVYRHVVWIHDYLRGNFDSMLQSPPLFHFIMLPFVAADFPMKYFQIIFAVLTIAGITFYLREKESEKAMLYSLILLATSITFIEYSGSLMPQGLDYFLFSLMLVAYYRGRDSYAIVIGAIVSLMHSTGELFIFILMAHAYITERKSFKKYLYAFLMLLPIFLFYVMLVPYWLYQYFPPVITYVWDAAAQAEWEAQFLQPTNFFIYSGFLVWILAPFALRKFYRKKLILTDTQLLYVIWIGTFFTLMLGSIGVWRMISYQMLPISLLVASIISEGDDEIFEL